MTLLIIILTVLSDLVFLYVQFYGFIIIMSVIRKTAKVMQQSVHALKKLM